ncbi:MAG: hypothetical protein ABJ251_03875 [Paracoccaceae bacterium]
MSRTDYTERNATLLEDAEKLAEPAPLAKLPPQVGGGTHKDTAIEPQKDSGLPPTVRRAQEESAQTFVELAQDARDGDTNALDSLSIALTGKSMEELADDPEQLAAFKATLKQFASGKIMPAVRVVPQGDIGVSGFKTVLPTGVSGAYVPGKDGAPGTILIAADAAKGPNLDELMLEEMGEAFADHARSLGLDVHEGDAGHRMSLMASDRPLSAGLDLFSSSGSDQVWVKLDGEDELAYAQQEAQAAGIGAVQSPFKGFEFNQEALTFMNEHAATRGTGQNLEGYSLTKETFLEAVEFAPGTEPSDAFLEMYTKHDVLPADASAGSIGMMALHKMFAAGVAYSSPYQPGKVFGDAAKAEGSTLAGGILDYKKAVAPNSDTSVATAQDVVAGLKALYGESASVPTLDQVEAIIFDQSGGTSLSYQQLTNVFVDGDLQPQTKVLGDGLTYTVLIRTAAEYSSVQPVNGVIPPVPDTSPDFVSEDGLTVQGEGLNPAAQFLVLNGQPAGPSAEYNSYTMTYAELKEAIGGTNGPSDALLDLYAGANGPSASATPGKSLNLQAIEKMFADGLISQGEGGTTGQPEFQLDLSKVDGELISDFIFADTIITDPTSNTVNGDQIAASLETLFPGASVPTGFTIQRVVTGYESVDGQGLDRATLGRVFNEEAIHMNVGTNGQMTITVTVKGTRLDNTVEGAPASATEFVQKWGEAAPGTYIGAHSGLVSYETLLGGGVAVEGQVPVDWQGQTPTEAFFELYRNKTSEGLGSGTTPEGFLSEADIQQMLDDGVLVLDSDAGMTFGHMENVDTGLLVDGVFRDFVPATGADQGADPVINVDAFMEGLRNRLATTAGPAILPSAQDITALFAQVASNRATSQDAAAAPSVTADELKELFVNKGLLVVQTAGDNTGGRIRVDTGAYQGEEAAATTEVFGAEGEGSEATVGPDALATRLGISLTDAELLTKLAGHKTKLAGDKDDSEYGYFLTQAEFSRLLKPDQVAVNYENEAVDFSPVVVFDEAGNATINWNNIKGTQITSHLFTNNEQVDGSLQPVELIDRMVNLFGAANIDPAKLSLIADRGNKDNTQEMNTQEMSVSFVNELFDNDVISLTSASGQGVTASLNLDGDIAGTSGIEQNNGFLSGTATDNIFAFDANNDGTISSVELKAFFDSAGATPDRGLPATEQSIGILGQVYASGTGTHTTNQRGGAKGSATAKETSDTFEFSRDDVQTMLDDGVIRAGYATSNAYATEGKEGTADGPAQFGAVLDLTHLPNEKLIAATFNGETTLSVDDFLNNLTGITGDVNPLKDAGVREFLLATVGTTDGSDNTIITEGEALELLNKGVITLTLHNDGSHIRTLPNFNALLGLNSKKVFDYLDADGSGTLADTTTRKTTPRGRGGPSVATTENLEISKLLTDVFGVEDPASILPAVQAQFPNGITKDQFTEMVGQAKVSGSEEYDLDQALRFLATAPQEGPLEFGLDEGDGTTPADGADGEVSTEEFSPMEGPDGALFSAELTMSAPAAALNVQLENGEGSVSELAIADVMASFKTARAGSTKRKHYLVMLVRSMQQRGLSAKEIGNQLTNSNVSGDELLNGAFNSTVLQRYEAEVANDAGHQQEFIRLYQGATDKIFSQNFGISDGKLVEGGGNPITFTGLLEKSGQWVLNQPDGFFADTSEAEATSLLESFSLMANFLASSNPSLLQNVAIKLQEEVGPGGISADTLNGDADGVLEVDFEELPPEQKDAADLAALHLLSERVQGDKTLASSVAGGRRVIQFLNLLAEKGTSGLGNVLKALQGNAVPGTDVLQTFGMTAGQFNTLKTDLNVHAFVKAGAGLLGVAGLAMRYGGMDPAALGALKSGDPRHIAGFTGQLLYITSYLTSSAPDVATRLKVNFAGQNWAVDDLKAEIGVWRDFFENRPAVADEAATFDTLLPDGQRTISSANFQSVETVKSYFGLDTPNPQLADIGMTEDQAAQAIYDWYQSGTGGPTLRTGNHGGLNKEFVEKMGDTPGSAQAVFISALGGDPTYHHSFQAMSISQFATDGFSTPAELGTFLKAGGMSDGAAKIVVSELTALNNELHTKHSSRFENGGVSIADSVAGAKADLLAEDPEVLNARQKLLQHVWQGNGTAFDGTTLINQQTTGGVVNTGNFFGSQNNFLNSAPTTVDFVPSMYPTPELPASSLRGGIGPTGIKPKGTSTLTKVFKGLKVAGSVTEWGADLVGAGTSIYDVVEGTRTGDDYDVATGSVGIANSVFNIAAIVLAGSGGALTLPVSILAGLTGVAQIIMGIAKPPADAGNLFADQFMSDYSDFPELFQEGAHDFLSDWYNDAKEAEQEAKWEEEGTDDANLF